MPKILFKRGKEANLPDLGAGEPGFTTDTNKIFIGTDGENIQLANQKDVDAINTVVTDMTKPIDGGLFTDTNTDTPIDGGGF